MLLYMSQYIFAIFFNIFVTFGPVKPCRKFKSNVRETWRVILVSEADMFLSESLRILAERLSQSEIGLPLRQICYYSPPKEVGVFSTEFKSNVRETWRVILVSEADIFLSESLRILAERLSQSET